MLAPRYRHPMTVSRQPRTRRNGHTTVDTSRIGVGGEAFDVVGVVDPLAALEAQREGERVGDVFGRGRYGPNRREAAGRVPVRGRLNRAGSARWTNGKIRWDSGRSRPSLRIRRPHETDLRSFCTAIPH